MFSKCFWFGHFWELIEEKNIIKTNDKDCITAILYIYKCRNCGLHDHKKILADN